MNLDNFPTHEISDPASGEPKQYHAASKYFVNVDPRVEDPHSLHTASMYNTFLLLKTRET